jgi:hypothetical protein
MFLNNAVVREGVRFDGVIRRGEIEVAYLHSARLMGEQLRYAVIWKGQWLAVVAWSAQRFAHRDGGLQRLQALIFAEAPGSWHLPV